MSGDVDVGLGLVLLGGFLQGGFALPMKRMPRWRWENTWLIYSAAGMLVLPWLMALATVPHLGKVLQAVHGATVAEVVLFGFSWGVGAALFGLGIDRVGMALAFAIVLGVTASLGSLLPFAVLHSNDLLTRQGYMLFAGLMIVTFGLLVSSIAGRRREQKLSGQALQRGGFRFWMGIVICILSGILSAMLNFSFVFGQDLQQATRAAGASSAMASNLIWALALSAGFLANAGYCVYLLQRNRTWGLLVQGDGISGYWLGAILMGAIWFCGPVLYGTGATDLGTLGAVLGWPLFMALDIISANIWGAVTGEWKGASRLTYAFSWAGILVLLVAIYVISRASTL